MTQNIGRYDYKFRETWLWFRVTWLQARWLSGDLTVIRCGISGDFVARLTLRGQKSLPHSLRNALNSIPRWFQWFFRSFVTYLAIFLDCSSSPCSSLLISKPSLCKTILFSFVLESCTKTDKLFFLLWRNSRTKSGRNSEYSTSRPRFLSNCVISLVQQRHAYQVSQDFSTIN